MTTRTVKTKVILAAAVMSVAVVGQVRALTSTWTPTAAGTTYDWNLAGNWTAGFPSAAGDVANVNDNIVGDETIRLQQNVSLGTLNLGDSNNTNAFSISSGTGVNTLTFQSSVAGGATFLNMTGGGTTKTNSISANVAVGGSSSLTMNFAGNQVLSTSGTFHTNPLGNAVGNQVTLTGGVVNTATWSIIGDLLGNGTITASGAGGITIQRTSPQSFTGTYVLNSGLAGSSNAGSLTVTTAGASITNAAAVILNGYVDATGVQKGGSYHEGSGTAFAANPGQRLTSNTVTLNGGTIEMVGQTAQFNASGTNWQKGLELVQDTTATVNLNSGYSLALLSGSTTTAGTRWNIGTVNRTTGASAYLRSTTLGALSRMTAGNGSSLTVGAGGAVGTQTMSIVPWLAANNGSVGVAPAGFATYDTTLLAPAVGGTATAVGFRALTAGEYVSSVSAGSTTNVSTGTIDLSSVGDKTVNSLLYSSASANNLGGTAGGNKKLTVTSGGLFFSANNGGVGQAGNANAGTVRFGAAATNVEGVVWSNANNTNTIGAAIDGSGGLTKAGAGTLQLLGTNTYSGKTTVSGGTLQVGNGTQASNLGTTGDVEVSAGSLLKLFNGNAIADTARLTLDLFGLSNGKISLAAGVNEAVKNLYFGGTVQASGTYGSTSSSATFKNDTYFTFGDTGILTVLPSQPGTLWVPKTAGTYTWNTPANWNAAVPNAAGAVANFDVGLTGDQTISMNQAITVGTLYAGDTGGTPGVKTTIASGSGGNPLTFQGAAVGQPTAINLKLSTAPASGYALNLPNVNLAANSPLKITVDSPAFAVAKIGTLNLNGNTVTLVGPPRTNSELSSYEGVSWDVYSLTGSGNYVQNGAGTHLLNPSPSFTGTVTVNNGLFGFETGSLTAATQYNLGGAWGNFSKYPKGGQFRVGHASTPLFTTLPDRLNHNAIMTFRSGFLEYSGQALNASLAGSDVVEQIRQMQFINGMSQIRMQDGNDVANSTTLLVNDPTNACVRQQGATVMVGGDDNRSRNDTWWLAMGAGEKLIFSSGMSAYLKGAGGADGTKSKSIIPWMTCGTLFHPSQGRFMTYDPVNGVRPLLTDTEYYIVPNTGTVYGIDPTYNVRTDTREASSTVLNLGAGHTQTINSFSTAARGNTDIGAGSTLTITSGALHLLGPAKIGTTSRAVAGTLNFGSAEGIVWTDFESLYGDNQIGSVITGTGGLTMAGNNRLILTAVNTYTGKTCVGSGIMQVGDGVFTDSKLGNGDLDVAAGGTLSIAPNVANAISDSAIVSLGDNGDVFFGMMDLSAGINETVGGLYLNGVGQPGGTYGSTSSSATFKLDNYFSGSGILTVPSGPFGLTVPEPATTSVFALGGLLLLKRRRQ